MKESYQKTVRACFTGYIVQAIINNLVPLLFLTFENTYKIPLEKITMLITFNFGVQLLVDLLSAGFIDRIGYRASIVMAHAFSVIGLVSLSFLPDLLPDAFAGLLISVILYGIGGGLIEVLVSPIMESCPSENKEKSMSLLHSFYCWGHMLVVLISTIYFKICGIENWKILTFLWAMVPLINGILFCKVPIASLVEDGEERMPVGMLCRNRHFWILMLMMLCAGASEQGVSQWASTFAEKGLHISKNLGDLAGPMAFALMMGGARVFYGKFGDRIHLDHFMLASSSVCVLAYLGIALFPSPILALLSCAVCGLSVGIMWPGTFSKASATLKNGGTALFALLALAGDVGCAGGPTLVGFVSGQFADDLKKGILAGVSFPVLLIIGIMLLKNADLRFVKKKKC